MAVDAHLYRALLGMYFSNGKPTSKHFNNQM